jgi:hypothetical protein
VAEACSQPRLDCKYSGTPECLMTRHHLAWPSTEYQEPIAKAFRDLPINSEYLSRCVHDEVHVTQEPPIKPPLEHMAQVVLSNSGFISRRLQKEIKKELRRGTR